MAESNSVRLLQHHLRQAGTLLAARQFDAASSHVDAALDIDPMSPAALTLRDRLEAQRVRPSRDDTPPAVEPARTPERFVPTGINAASWLDFEQRVQDRRFRALIEAADRAVAVGDGAAARSAVEEARELRPDASDIVRLSARIALLQMPAAVKAREGVLFSRTFRAAGLLLLGVTLLMGLDWVQSSAPGSGSVPRPAAAAPTTAESRVDALTIREPDAQVEVPATLGTSGSAGEPSLLSEELTTPVATAPALIATPPAAQREEPVASNETPDNFFVRAPVQLLRTQAANPPFIRGEVPDDYIAPRRDASRDITPVGSTLNGAASPPALASVVRQPAPIAEPLLFSSSPAPLLPVTSSAAVPVAAAAVVAPSNSLSEQSRVRSVLDQYASAYGRLSAAAVRSVWPLVDEKALNKAFSDLSSQSMSFNSCDITVTGVVARASCRGPASYVKKYGSQVPHTETHTVRFDLKREGETWKIQKAETRK